MSVATIKYAVFYWRYHLPLLQKVGLALVMAIITGLAAQISIPLPWTPVPITGQTFAVLLSGIFLGGSFGALSQIFYLTFGAFGVPWFAAGNGGYLALIGPSGGYLIGFVLASFFLGSISDKYVAARKFFPMLFLMLFSSIFLIFLPGILQLKFWFSLNKNTTLDWWSLLMMGVIPFLPGDVIKICLAAWAAKAITPKVSFDQ
jgi:biotin transport system substrate-specific component